MVDCKAFGESIVGKRNHVGNSAKINLLSRRNKPINKSSLHNPASLHLVF